MRGNVSGHVGTVATAFEINGDARVAQGRVVFVGQQVLFRDIGLVHGFLVFGVQMVERLVLARTDSLRNGFVPFVRIAEYRVHIIDDAAKRIDTVSYYLTDTEFCVSYHAEQFNRQGCFAARILP